MVFNKQSFFKKALISWLKEDVNEFFHAINGYAPLVHTPWDHNVWLELMKKNPRQWGE